MNELTKLQNELGLKNANGVKTLEDYGLLGGDYFPELRQVSSGDLVNKFSQKAGDFCFKKGEQVTALGRDIDVVVLAMRPKAIDYNEMRTSYDPESPIFRAIQTKAGSSDSGCAVGTEFLVYVPAVKGFACYHAGNKSARKASITLASNIGSVMHGNSYLAEKGKYSWWAPKWTESDAEIEVPDIEEARSKLQKFQREVEDSANAEQMVKQAENKSTGREV